MLGLGLYEFTEMRGKKSLDDVMQSCFVRYKHKEVTLLHDILYFFKSVAKCKKLKSIIKNTNIILRNLIYFFIKGIKIKIVSIKL